MFGLDHKRKGLDLRQFGKADTKRATLIEWDTDRQKWYVLWMDENEEVDFHLGVSELPKGRTPEEFNATLHEDPAAGPLFFDDYEDAIAFEVAVIQKLQQEGNLTENG